MIRHESATAAVSPIRSEQRVFVHGGMATPLRLLQGLVERAGELRNVELIHLHTCGDAPYAEPELAESFRVTNLFVGGNMRKRFDGDRIDYLPCFLSEIPALFRSGRRPLDVALLHLSPPDSRGLCTLGVSVDVALAAMQSAKIRIAQINHRMPRVHGEGFIHIDDLEHVFEIDEPLPVSPPPEIGEEELEIGRHIAGLVEDGSTLQTGIGSIPDAVLRAMDHHRNLGIHTEMYSDGVVDLIESGAVNNSQKAVYKGRTLSGFVMGTERVYDFLHDNPAAVQACVSFVNNTSMIRMNPKVVAINSAVEIDLSGQICADSIGHRIISGVGGQMDFMRGASLSEGGKPIIALTSRTRRGEARIVPTLKPGAGVVTTRAHVHYVVTEFGVADLYGRTLNERAEALITISHPDDREDLARRWHDARSRLGS